MLTPEQQDLLARHVAAENAHRMEDTLATLHPDCVFEDMAMQRRWHGRDGARRYYEAWWRAFELQVRGRRRHVTTDGRLVAEASYVGRHVGEFFGLAASGRPIELELAVIIGFRDGLMEGERFYYDLLGLVRQLGAAPEALRLDDAVPA
ncbi:MAG: ester cyclase [Rubrivivax sp.]|nr:ester cyclase [Rubrivivax sp.]